MTLRLRRIVTSLALGAMLCTTLALAAPQHTPKKGKSGPKKSRPKKGGRGGSGSNF